MQSETALADAGWSGDCCHSPGHLPVSCHSPLAGRGVRTPPVRAVSVWRPCEHSISSVRTVGVGAWKIKRGFLEEGD